MTDEEVETLRVELDEWIKLRAPGLSVTTERSEELLATEFLIGIKFTAVVGVSDALEFAPNVKDIVQLELARRLAEMRRKAILDLGIEVVDVRLERG